MFFFARSSRVQVLFAPILIIPISFVFLSANSSFTTSTCENVSVITSLLRRASVSMLEVVCPSILLELDFPPVWSSELPCAPTQCSFSASLFKGLCTFCARSGMLLLLAIPILCQRYPWCTSWSFKPFEIHSFSILRCHTINTISRYRCVTHDCK